MSKQPQPVTYKGKWDHHFVDDRDPVQMAMTDEEKMKAANWSPNSLDAHKPRRTFTAKEIAAANRIGMPNTDD